MVLKISLLFILFLILTVVTQVGGFFLLVTVLLFWRFGRVTQNKFLKLIVAISLFGVVYCAGSFLLVPSLAKRFGRVALPVTKNEHLKPLTLWTCLLNRHYVKPELYQAMLDISEEISREYPEVVIAYLDGNFPFINDFPLIPHLSHNDGEKLDLAFFYKETASGREVNKVAPSFVGYGVSEKPENGEIDQPFECEKMGYWQYSILQSIIPQPAMRVLVLDNKRTSVLLKLLNNNVHIRKIFLEPHLVQRLKLENKEKIHFHGCHAVRHDDHIHIQL